MALQRTTEITQIRVLPIPEQQGPDGNVTGSEWRVNVYAEVVFADPEDPSMEPVRTPHVTTYRQGDNWSGAESEVQEICNTVFRTGSSFYPALAEPELA